MEFTHLIPDPRRNKENPIRGTETNGGMTPNHMVNRQVETKKIPLEGLKPTFFEPIKVV